MREIDLVRLLSLVFAMKQCSIEGLKFLIDAGEATIILAATSKRASTILYGPMSTSAPLKQNAYELLNNVATV